MPTNVSLKCACGSVRGIACDVSPQSKSRIVCLCDDCQAYAHYLGKAEVMLDKNGGTDIYQLTPSQVKLTSGQEHLRCLRLTPRGLMRWYAECCNSPIANTLGSAKMSFVGMPNTFMDHKGDGRSRDELLGPQRLRIYGCFGHGKLPEGTHAKVPVRFFLRVFWFIVSSSIKKRNRPSPFFDEQSGKPAVEPKVLSREQREELFRQANLAAK